MSMFLHNKFHIKKNDNLLIKFSYVKFDLKNYNAFWNYDLQKFFDEAPRIIKTCVEKINPINYSIKRYGRKTNTK